MNEKEVEQEILKQSSLVDWLIIIFASALTAWIVALALRTEESRDFGYAQSVEQIHTRYKSCKDHAPKGMDCVMVPMMVANDYMKELKNAGR